MIPEAQEGLLCYTQIMDPQPVSPQTPQVPPSPRFPFLLVFLALLVLLLSASTTYLAYQNIQLQKEVTRLSSQQMGPVSSPTPDSTIQMPPESNGQFCGGFAGVECPSGYTCQLEGNYPDAGGTCVQSSP